MDTDAENKAADRILLTGVPIRDTLATSSKWATLAIMPRIEGVACV
ncbi:MAG: hypothetical protein ACNA7W_01245 [Pseudomonadales bacterium]